ncbi:hypothetical protein ACFQDN_21885 [Pseudomonas asuensis]|uniref:Uncharacterized protein n=1 Tax=Pseudomonas asuensis TaxID=1825787 RepID=A0ABQ2H1C7_9PSED|nr:hypothetical protein [Pseudomonas asuensis]GGM25427.1 hypothetical protein GCM10009425_40220 [Pseudomonas asuensis]
MTNLEQNLVTQASLDLEYVAANLPDDDIKPAQPTEAELEALRHYAELYLWLRERTWYVDAAANALGLIKPRRAWSDPPPKPDWDEVEEALEALMSDKSDYESDYE